MPIFQLPQVLTLPNKRSQLADYLLQNNICKLEQFLDTVKTGNVQKLKKLNYLESYLNDPAIDHPALILAAYNKHHNMVTHLLNEGANINITARGFVGNTALHTAVLIQDTKLIDLLLARGTDLEAENSEGRTPLHLAAFRGDSHLKTAELLLKHRANLFAKAKEKTLLGSTGNTPLHVSVEYDYHDQKLMIAMLIGKDHKLLEAKNSIGLTPLHWACAKGAEEGAKILLSHGADLEATVENEQATALYLAAENNRPEIVSLLLKHGANVNNRAYGNTTPLSVADRNGFHEVKQILIAHGAKSDSGSDFVERNKVKPSESYQFMSGVLNQNAPPIKISDKTPIPKKMESQETVSKELFHNIQDIKQILNKIIPGESWKVPTLAKAWLQLSDERTAKGIVAHFKKNGYGSVQLSRRLDSPLTSVIVLQIDYDNLCKVPTIHSSNVNALETSLGFRHQ